MYTSGVQQTSRAVAPLTRERLVEEALQTVESEGFAALSLRAVARRLGVTPMALYRYVESSAELADLVVSRIISERTEQTKWPREPRAALRMLAITVVDLVRDHPVLLDAYERGGVMTPPAMRAVDDILGALHAGGFSPDAALDAYLAVHCYALGYAALILDTSDSAGHGTPDPDEYPVLGRHYDLWLTLRSDQRFLNGLELVLDGAVGRRKSGRR